MMNKQRSPIQIDADLHLAIKNYCKKEGLVMKSLIEKLINNELSKNLQSNLPKSEIRTREKDF